MEEKNQGCYKLFVLCIHLFRIINACSTHSSSHYFILENKGMFPDCFYACSFEQSPLQSAAK